MDPIVMAVLKKIDFLNKMKKINIWKILRNCETMMWWNTAMKSISLADSETIRQMRKDIKKWTMVGHKQPKTLFELTHGCYSDYLSNKVVKATYDGANNRSDQTLNCTLSALLSEKSSSQDIVLFCSSQELPCLGLKSLIAMSILS